MGSHRVCSWEEKVDSVSPVRSPRCWQATPPQGWRDGNQSAAGEQEGVQRGQEALSHSAHWTDGGGKVNGLFVNKWFAFIETHSPERFWNPHPLMVYISAFHIPLQDQLWDVWPTRSELVGRFLKVWILGVYLRRVLTNGSRWTRELVFLMAPQKIPMSSQVGRPLQWCSD